MITPRTEKIVKKTVNVDLTKTQITKNKFKKKRGDRKSLCKKKHVHPKN